MRRASALLLLLLSSCSAPEAPRGEFADRDAQADGTRNDAPSDAVSEGESVLVPDGIWLLWAETSSCIKLGASGLETLSESVMRIELSQSAPDVLVQKLKNCVIEQSPVLGVPTTFPQALIDSIPSRTFTSLLDAPTTGATYQSQLDVEVWAAKLADPVHDTLPINASDPRVYDMDGDGKPGVTLLVGASCQMQVVERSFARWTGTVTSGDRIEGGGQTSYEQNVLSASSGFCASNPPPWFPANANRFVLLRIDGKHGAIDLDENHDGDVSCDEIAAYGLAPLGPRAPDNGNCDAPP
jgi:hypothetical protein